MNAKVDKLKGALQAAKENIKTLKAEIRTVKAGYNAKLKEAKGSTAAKAVKKPAAKKVAKKAVKKTLKK